MQKQENLENLTKYILDQFRFGYFDVGRVFPTCNGCPDEDEVAVIRNS
jgi:hypothetical protein